MALEMLGDGHESDDDSNRIIPMDLKTESLYGQVAMSSQADNGMRVLLYINIHGTEA